MTKNKKFHINSNDEVKPCNATLRECRFGSNDAHYESFDEASLAVEKKLSEKNDVLTATKKKAKISVNKIVDNEYINALKNKINNSFNKNIRLKSNDVDEFQEYIKNYTPDNLMNVGKVFEEELSKRVGFELDGDLSEEQFKKLEEETHILMNELTGTGDKLKNDLYGSLSKQLDSAVKVLPNSVKQHLAKTPILVKATRIDNGQFDGQHSGNTKFQTYVKSTGKKISEFEKSLIKKVPNGAIYFKDFVFADEIGSGWGSRASVKKEGAEVFEEVWIGDGLQKQYKGKKISDSAEVFFNGKMNTIDKPVYEIKDSLTLTGSVILAKKNFFNGKDISSNPSVLMHEYVHLAQVEDNSFAEHRMFDSLKEEEYFDESLSVKCRKGFPDEYMGLSNGRELLTRASEGFYYPSSNPYLYSSKRGNNADKVRQWIMGYWIARNKTLSSESNNF